eukprot:719107-Pleurochrysis_carterae.AAC.4
MKPPSFALPPSASLTPSPLPHPFPLPTPLPLPLLLCPLPRSRSSSLPRTARGPLSPSGVERARAPRVPLEDARVDVAPGQPQQR